MTTPDPSRAAFEQWYIEDAQSLNIRLRDWTREELMSAYLERRQSGLYRSESANSEWKVWQAAMAHKGAAQNRPESEQTRMDAGATPLPTNGWQPIETAPKDGTKFLAYRPLAHLTHDPHIRVVKGTPHNYGCWEATVPPGYSLENFTDGACRATHWQPLPAAPKQEGST